MFVDRGIDALVNDSLVSMSGCLIRHGVALMIDCMCLALTWGAYAIGLMSSLFAYLYLRCERTSLYLIHFI